MQDKLLTTSYVDVARINELMVQTSTGMSMFIPDV